jgi:nucleotide-binding universal stress UspA family protein
VSGPAVPDRPPGDTRRHLLLAVDDSEGSRRAVMYVADFFGGFADLFVTLLSILPEPPEDLFRTDGERREALLRESRSREALLGEYRRLLAAGGIRDDRIATRLSVRRCASLADAILEEQEQLRCCIVVVGRRGLSRHEEFLFGSTSNRILHRAQRCAVLIVE